MACLTMTDLELHQLILKIVTRNTAGDILSWLEQAPGKITKPNWLGQKSLGYGDYGVAIKEFVVKDGTVMETNIEFWRSSRVLGNIGNRNLMKLLYDAVNRRYGPNGNIVGIRASRGIPFIVGGDISWGAETTILYRPEAVGMTGKTTNEDIINFKFKRLFD